MHTPYAADLLIEHTSRI